MAATLILSICLALAGQVAEIPPEDPFALNEEMKQFVDQHIDKSTDRLQQLQTLVRVVFQENALRFVYVPETRTAAETFSKRGGNCVSFTFLFISMARYLGYDARFREVEIAPIWSQVGNITSLGGHSNAAVFIGAQGYVVDLFPRVNAIQLGGRIVSDARALAHFFNNRGVDRIVSKEPGLAIAYFEKALEADPTTSNVWVNKGVAHTFLREESEAEKCYLWALQLDAGELPAMNNLAVLYERLGRKGEARNLYTKVQKFNQRNPYYHYNLGMQAYQTGDYRVSVDRFRTALKLKPAEHHFHLALAKAYAKLGIMDKAGNSLRLAAKHAPDDASRSLYNEKLAYLIAHQQRT